MCSRICIPRRSRAEPSGLLPRFWTRLGRPLQRPSASMCVLMWSQMSRRRAPNSSTVSVQGCLLRHRLPAPDPSSPAKRLWIIEFGRLEQKISLERTNINEYIGENCPTLGQMCFAVCIEGGGVPIPPRPPRVFKVCSFFYRFGGGGVTPF